MADYVLPALTKLAADGEVAVRCALAAHLGRIAQAADDRFLEIAQWMRAASLNSGDESGGGPRRRRRRRTSLVRRGAGDAAESCQTSSSSC